jgi:hypothetical protein
MIVVDILSSDYSTAKQYLPGAICDAGQASKLDFVPKDGREHGKTDTSGVYTLSLEFIRTYSLIGVNHRCVFPRNLSSKS